VMAAARANEVEYLPDGGVRLGGVELKASEVEIIATPRAGTAVAHDEGVVVVIDTEIDDSLRAEGDAREIARAVQDLRKQAELELDDQIELWLSAPASTLDALDPYLEQVARDTLASVVHRSGPPADVSATVLALSGADMTLAIRRIEDSVGR
jgi:isoleucyl-tRNA synthetase